MIVSSYKDILLKNALFSGMSEIELTHSLERLSASLKEYKKGEVIVHREEKMRSFGLVARGHVQVVSDDIMGNRMIMATVGEGESYGESLCILEVSQIPVSVIAVTDCTVVHLSLDNLNGEMDELNMRFLRMLATKTLSMNDRIQVLSKTTLREKLYAFFSQMCYKTGKRMFTLPFNREDFAIYLGVNRSALSRELSKLQREGIIEFYRGSFKIIGIE